MLKDFLLHFLKVITKYIIYRNFEKMTNWLLLMIVCQGPACRPSTVHDLFPDLS